MQKRYILAIDQGTTGTTVLLVDDAMNVVGRSTSEFPQIFPRPGWVEHDPEDIWESVLGTIGRVLGESGVDPGLVAGIGITNQRETSVLWERGSGRAVHNAIVWQCRRTADRCASLRAAGHGPLVRERTGLVVDAYFSGTKVRWMLDQPGVEARALAGELAFGTIDSFLVWRLTGGVHVTDVSNASRTMLMGLSSLDWDDRMLDLLGVPRAVLPAIRGSAEVYGHTVGNRVLPAGIPVAGMAGDQQAALFGQACFEPGEAKLTYGTGCFMLVNTGPTPVPSQDVLTTVAWRLGDVTTYALEGSAFIAGAAVQWLRDGLGVIRSAPEIEELARRVPDSGEVVFVPAFVGLGAPHWREGARGAILGLTRGSTAAHIARACLDGIALQNCDLLDAMARDRGEPTAVIKVDGGACSNDLLMQLQADLSGVEVVRPRNTETTAMGAVFLAGLGAGVWSSLEEIRAVWREDRRFLPAMLPAEVRAMRDRWASAVARA
ncbi:MAG: glycerol kinase [Myxococcales bacterium]